MKNLFKKKNQDIIKDDFRIDGITVEDSKVGEKNSNSQKSTTSNQSFYKNFENSDLEMKKTPFGVLALFSVGILILSITVILGYYLFWSNRMETNENSLTKVKELQVVSEESAIISSVEKNGPAVVNIYAYYTTRNSNQSRDPRESIGMGSGVIIESDGLILTNKHVLKNSGNRIEFEVVLKDERSFKVERVYQDPILDLAVIKINASDLPTVEMGDSDNLKLGQSVIAIGNPMGLSNSVTKGVVSALNREIDVNTSWFESSTYDGMIQTDAAINPGNSGGGLFNLSGQLVGINSAADLSSNNIGFAIPINKAKEALEVFKNNGSEMQELGQAFLGISYSFQDFSYYIRNGVPIGPIVDSVVAGSGAEMAGVKEGDIIVSVDDVEFYSERDLADFISSKGIGQKVRLKIYREEKILYLEATLTKKE